MAKKNKGNDAAEEPQEAPYISETTGIPGQGLQPNPLDKLPLDLPKETKEKLEHLKEKIDAFQKRLMEKFEEYVVGSALLPPSKDEKEQHKINLLVLIDDSDSKKMTKEELKEKLTTIINSVAQDVDKNLNVDTILITELWQSCYDGKYEILEMIANAAPIFDRGMLAAVKIAEIHKKMVLQKFEKYIVSYVLAGSLVQGKATPKSDVDVFIVIDDTDVKRMTRGELKDKLRAIIIGMGVQASQMTGIEKAFNIQVYILTDFWDYIKEASPVIFTFLRDGVPLYDRGIFMPWKQLLQMGRVKPSPEAIEMFMHSGEQIIDRINFKLSDIVMEDLFYAMLTPSQAALMMYGIPPPTPKETPQMLREVFVQKEKMMEEEYVKMLEKVIQMRKDIEHGDKKKVSGKEVDEMLGDAGKYLKRLQELFKQIDERKEEESVLHTYETVVTVIRDVLKLEGISKASDKDIIDLFEKEVVHKGSIPEKFTRILKAIEKAKQDYDTKKLSKTDIQQMTKDSHELIRFLVDYMQRKRGREMEQSKLRVKHGKSYAEVILVKGGAYIIHDIEAPEKEISKAEMAEDGALNGIAQISIEDFEKALATETFGDKMMIKEKFFHSLKAIFGKDVEIMLS